MLLAFDGIRGLSEWKFESVQQRHSEVVNTLNESSGF